MLCRWPFHLLACTRHRRSHLSPACKSCPLPWAGKASFLSTLAGKASPKICLEKKKLECVAKSCYLGNTLGLGLRSAWAQFTELFLPFWQFQVLWLTWLQPTNITRYYWSKVLKNECWESAKFGEDKANDGEMDVWSVIERDSSIWHCSLFGIHYSVISVLFLLL